VVSMVLVTYSVRNNSVRNVPSIGPRVMSPTPGTLDRDLDHMHALIHASAAEPSHNCCRRSGRTWVKSRCERPQRLFIFSHLACKSLAFLNPQPERGFTRQCCSSLLFRTLCVLRLPKWAALSCRRPVDRRVDEGPAGIHAAFFPRRAFNSSLRFHFPLVGRGGVDADSAESLHQSLS